MLPILLLSYGAPEQHEDVVPFLNNLFAGKEVSAERFASAIRKYEHLAAKTGHYSPLNSECRKMIDTFRQLHPDPPQIYWGNLFWHPLLVDTVAEMAKSGVERAVCFATSAFDSPSGNGRYAAALESACRSVGTKAPILEKLPLPFEHPLFIEAQTERLHLAGTPRSHRGGDTPRSFVSSRILFSAHSIPHADAARSHYVEQLQTTCRLVIEQSGTTFPWELVYQSRSGRAEDWLGPDIKERIRNWATEGGKSVIVSPLGFFCENMETVYDLDIEAGELCAELGLSLIRSKAVGTMPIIGRLILELAAERR